MSRQRRFKDESEILKAIDLAKNELFDKRRQREIMHDHWKTHNEYDREQAEKMDRSIKRIETVKLKQLSEALAAMRTQTFPFVEDKSVVV